ncbi:peptidoglycan-binding domain-containing protein [Shimia abyssi]|uniref:Putative peptidoglycan binding protein n=1 Tax=Shimia abyssi TaxID=1662395 RepID=A0A2P8F7L6_9RHOB|nr:peptidoglycan-binding domain-containing protein [Shimia abyssi]PSL17697.1 putative peptidoglycan binding protein [Shimia abyssi]
MTSLPDDKDCEKVEDDGETLYLCDGVLYRATYQDDEQVYEIVSDPVEEDSAEPQSVIGLALTTPMTQGQIVRDLQNRLVALGYDVGTVDGVFGTATETAILWLQYDNQMDQTGFVDRDTAEHLGFDVPPAPSTEDGTEKADAEAATEVETETEGGDVTLSDN